MQNKTHNEQRKASFPLSAEVVAQAQEITKGFDNVNFPSQQYLANSMEQKLEPDTIYKPRRSEDAASSNSPGSQHQLNSKGEQ